MDPQKITQTLLRDLEPLTFTPPVAFVYNPLTYAARPYAQYLKKYGHARPREVMLVGMNPGPWGMAQTGVPFGEVNFVRDWMGIEGKVDKPPREHPKRCIEGFACTRSEVSGARLWGWAKQRFGTADAFFSRFFVANYCPLVFMEDSSRNLTPDKLPKEQREPLLEACDQALQRLIDYFEPRWVIGVGAFAEARIRAAARDSYKGTIGRITHPSPASPIANKGWAARIESELQAMGIRPMAA